MNEAAPRASAAVPAKQAPVLVKVLGFSLALALLFTVVANTLPQVEGEAPEEEVLDVGALTTDSFVALGETIFNGKGTCSLCHNNLGRAPDLLAMNVVAVAAERLADARYKGAAADPQAYLRESMVAPSAYVVEGFGKKGSDDAQSPMPSVDKAPIQLTAVETDAVIAFMQAKDGNPVTVALPSEPPEPVPESTGSTAGSIAPITAAPIEASSVPPPSPETVAAKYACAACHTMLGTESPVGPELVSVGNRLSAEEIRQSVIDPAAVITEGYPPGLMPGDFAKRMTIGELEVLVKFLVESTE